MKNKCDREISDAIINIVENFPKLKISTVMQSKFAETLQNHPDFKNVDVIQERKLNESILAISVQNPGFSTMLNTLLSMKMKIPPNFVDPNSLLYPFTQFLSQQICTLKIPDFFIGKTFNEIQIFIYFYQYDYESYQKSLINLQNQISSQNNDNNLDN